MQGYVLSNLYLIYNKNIALWHIQNIFRNMLFTVSIFQDWHIDDWKSILLLYFSIYYYSIYYNSIPSYPGFCMHGNYFIPMVRTFLVQDGSHSALIYLWPAWEKYQCDTGYSGALISMYCHNTFWLYPAVIKAGSRLHMATSNIWNFLRCLQSAQCTFEQEQWAL